MKRLICILLILLLPLSVFADGTVFHELKRGDKGEAVSAFKQRLYELEYYSSGNFNDKFSSDTAETLRLFQEDNGLPVTGVLDEATYTRLFSDEAIGRYDFLSEKPVFPKIEWPERDADGYLAGSGEFFYENEEDGCWAYLSDALQIYIIRCVNESFPLEWFETEIFMRGEETIHTVETNPARPGTRFSYPFDIAVDNGYVLGFSDDFYGHRISHNQKVGVVIRDGKVIGNKTYSSKRLHNLPNLDVMAQFADGSLKCYASNEKTAQELLDLGAVNVFCFGPILVRNGELDELVAEGFYETKSPRQAFGMVEPGHYMLISVQGRMTSSEGCGLQLIARIIKNRGAVEALNLDGGQTMALIFNGKMLNKLGTYESRTFVRTVTSLIGVGIRKDFQAE